MEFQWSNAKNQSHQKKHGVSFEDASTIFFDTTTKVANDPEHSFTEERFLAIGYSSKQKLLLVIHCYQDDSEFIRIISARKATKQERRQFEEGL